MAHIKALKHTLIEKSFINIESAIWRDNAEEYSNFLEAHCMARSVVREVVLDELKLWQRYTPLLSVSTSVQSEELLFLFF